ncbi:MAG: hypothetical protein WDW38_005576 [Sanguina aurantia]
MCIGQHACIHHICKPMIIHRDMKLDNLLLSGLRAKLADFGLHKRAEKSTEGGQIREAGNNKYKWSSTTKSSTSLGEKFFGADTGSKSSKKAELSSLNCNTTAPTPVTPTAIMAQHNYANEQSYYGGAAYYNLLPGKANPSVYKGSKGGIIPSSSTQNLASDATINNNNSSSKNSSANGRGSSSKNNSGSGRGGGGGSSAHGRTSPSGPPSVPSSSSKTLLQQQLPPQPPVTNFQNGSADRAGTTSTHGGFQQTPEPINADAESAYAASFAAASHPVYNSIIYMASLTPPGPLVPAGTAASLFHDMTLDEQRKIEKSVQPFLENTDPSAQPAASLAGTTAAHRTRSGQFSDGEGGSRHGPALGPGENMFAHAMMSAPGGGGGGRESVTYDGPEDSVRRKMLALHNKQQQQQGRNANGRATSSEILLNTLSSPSPSSSNVGPLTNSNMLSLSDKMAALGGGAGGGAGGERGGGEQSRRGGGRGRASLSMAAIVEGRAAGRQSMEVGIGHRHGDVGSPYMQAAAAASAAAATKAVERDVSGGGAGSSVGGGGSGSGAKTGVGAFPKLSTMSLHCGPKLKDATTQVGSFMYMAPELLLGLDYNEKIDVFSFAIIMYEMFVGRLLALKSEIVSSGTEGVEAYTKIYDVLDRMTKDDALASMCKAEESVGCSCCIS